MERKHAFLLGPWEVRPLTGEISGVAGSVHLEPKVMEVLLVLAEHSREVVERDDLLRRVWGSRAAVSDEPLTRCIAELRRALGDSRQEPVYIQTIPKRGYRLLISVTAVVVEEPPQGPAEEQIAPPFRAPEGAQPLVDSTPLRKSGPRSGGMALLGAAVVLVGIVGVIAVRYSSRDSNDQGPIGANTIAVLPFVDVSNAADSAYFGEGLADEILSRLSGVNGLHVVARTSSFSVRASTDDVRDIAARLRVANVLEGSVRRSGEEVRISAQLIDAQRGYQLWAASYDGRLDDIFALQDEIANAIVAKLRETVTTVASGEPIATRPPTGNFAAYELLLRGRQYLNRRDEEPLRRSIRLFQQAIDADPSYGYAYVELAKAYALLPTYSAEVQDEMFDVALATVAAGIEQDPTVDAPMHSVLALIAFARWDWITAEIAFRRALEQSPNDPDLLVWYSQFLAAVGRPAASADYARRAKELDLLSPVVNHRLSVALMWVDEDAEASRYAQIAEELGMGPVATPDAYIVLKLRQSDYAAIRPLLIGSADDVRSFDGVGGPAARRACVRGPQTGCNRSARECRASQRHPTEVSIRRLGLSRRERTSPRDRSAIAQRSPELQCRVSVFARSSVIARASEVWRDAPWSRAYSVLGSVRLAGRVREER